MDTRSRSTTVLMFPWLAHGHIAPFLQLAKALSTKNFVTYICSSQINLNSIKKYISPKDSISIKLVELLIPPTPDLPPHYHTTNGLPPHLMGPLKEAFDTARPAFATLLSTLKPDLLVYDFLQPWAPEEAAAQNIPAVVFFSTGAASTSLMVHHFAGRSPSEYPFPAIHFRENEHSVFSRLNKNEDSERVMECIRRSCDVVLIKSFREMEGKYIDFLSRENRKRFVPVGPLVHEPADEDDVRNGRFIEWLDRKEAGSTVFASFGSEYFLSEDEIEEVAYGLEESGVNFIWVVRFPLDERVCKVEDRLPLGFVERVKGRGMVVEGWAPQRVILSHRSVGGFLSHCGWSSVMEALYSGVLIVAAPMQLDQPLNARVVVEGEWGEEVGRIERGEVARAVKKVVVEESGEEVRRRVAEMSEKMRRKGEEEIGGVVEEMVKLCWRRERMNLESEDSIKKLDRMLEENDGERILSENT